MILVSLLLVAALFGLGFVNALWWVAGAVLFFGYVHYGRRSGPGRRRLGEQSTYEEYRDARDREDRWNRRYQRRRRGR